MRETSIVDARKDALIWKRTIPCPKQLRRWLEAVRGMNWTPEEFKARRDSFINSQRPNRQEAMRKWVRTLDDLMADFARWRAQEVK